MALVTEKAGATDAAAHQRQLTWALRLLVIVLVVQILGGAGLLVALRPDLLRPATMRRVEVVEPRGSKRPSVPEEFEITSQMWFYFNDVKQEYKPQDESDAIERACNLLAERGRGEVRIERVVRVKPGRAFGRR